MYEIQVIGTQKAKLEIAPDYYWEHSGDNPRKAVMNLMYFLETELNKLENVDPEHLTLPAQAEMKVLKRFVRGVEE